MPRVSKDPSVRARRNKTSTRATLTKPTNPKIPPLPTGTRWRKTVLDWWKRTWSSPMVPEWTESDVDNLYLAAKLMQLFWDPDTSPTTCKQLAGEIRQLHAQCGLTPMARRSLQWEIERVEEAQERGKKRRAAAKPAGDGESATSKRADPRARRGLRAV